MIGNKLLKTVIVVPTFNEKENIGNLLEQLLAISKTYENSEIHVLIVDDNSPDGTGKMVQQYIKDHSTVHLLTQQKKGGLGKAYIEGFKYAINKLHADVVFEMDADLSHNPADIPRFLNEIIAENDFVIGSRYVPGGSIPQEWSLIRKLNSKFGNLVARFIAGIYEVKDCTSGFRAIRTSLISSINLNELGVKGYSFQMNLLHAAYTKQTKIKEVPINFIDRVYGKSKLKFADISEFIINAFYLRFPFLKSAKRLLFFLLLVGAAFYSAQFISSHDSKSLITSLIVWLSIFLFVQSSFNLFTMLYAWEDIEETKNNSSPDFLALPKHSFSVIVPARHEEKVLPDTLKALSKIDYPDDLTEFLIVCRQDDVKTIFKAQETIDKIGKSNMKVVTFYDYPINKPHGLNVGLLHSTKDYVAVFDAEDSPHKDLFKVVNTAIRTENADIVQSGVQLMNWDSNWFSTLNVLEYYFWFKSTLHYYSKCKTLPLGGNTVFIKKEILDRVGGWDENCLTEDADIGLRLSVENAKFKVIYDEEYVTKEETPPNVISFIKQRTRWNQGFFQIFSKGDWLKLPNLKQKLLFIYILLLPIFQSLLIILVPVSLVFAIYLKIPVVQAMLSFIPLIMLALQLVVYNIGIYEFTKAYKMKYSPSIPFRLALSFLPYQMLLSVSAFRAFYRIISGANNWEKTVHINAHRAPNVYGNYLDPINNPALAVYE